MGKGFPYSSRRGQAAVGPSLTSELAVVFPVRNVSLTVAAAGAGIGFGSVVIGDFPAGDILILGASSQLQFLTASANITNATYVITYSVGSDPTVAGALTTTEANIIKSTAAGAATAKLTPVTRARIDLTSGALTSNTILLDNQNGAQEVNLSAFVAAADITDATSAAFTVNGYVSIAYLVL